MADLAENELSTPAPVEIEPNDTAPLADTAPETEAPRADPAVEERARAMGWVDKDQFRGPADKWRPADEFVQRGENELPILRENVRRATDTITRMERDYAQRLEGIQRATVVALQNQREQLAADYDQRMRDAVNYGDLNTYDSLRQQQQQHLHQFDQQAAEAIAAPAPQPQAPSYTPDQAALVQRWQQSNPWYGRDPEISSVAYHYSTKLGRDKPHMSLAENLAETERYVAQKYPESFPSRARGGASPVEAGGSRMSTTTPRGKSAADLPIESVAMGRQFVKDGLFKDLNAYAKAFFEG